MIEPLKIQPLIEGNSSLPLTEGFALGGRPFRVQQRVDRCYGISARYLAADNEGNRVCLTQFPYDEIRFRHRELPDYQTAIAKRAFETEEPILRKLAGAEEATETHYFPRVLGVSDSLTYAIEYIEGGDVRDIPVEDLPHLRNEFLKAMEIAHRQGIHFSDLREEDLRVLPEGRCMMIDFNSTEYRVPVSSEEAERMDFERLDKIFKRVASKEN